MFYSFGHDMIMHIACIPVLVDIILIQHKLFYSFVQDSINIHTCLVARSLCGHLYLSAYVHYIHFNYILNGIQSEIEELLSGLSL